MKAAAFLDLARRLLDDEDGSPSVMLGLAAPALAGIAGVAIDLGHLYVAERELQGIADASASAAVAGNILQDGQQAAQNVIDFSELGDIDMIEYIPGYYAADPDADFDERFIEGTVDANAARVVLQRKVPLFFGSFLAGNSDSTVAVSSTAARSDRVAFDLGSKLLTSTSNVPNMLLSQLAGAPLNLTPDQIEALLSIDIDVLTFADRLRTIQDDTGLTYGEVFDQTSALADAVLALAAASENSDVSALLTSIAADLSGDSLVMSELIELGFYRHVDFDDGRSGAEVDAYSLLRSILEASHGESYTIEFDVALAGLANAMLKIVGGYAYERSPWLTLSTAGDVTLRTAQTRIYFEAETASSLGALGRLRIPLYTELASAEAQITDVACTLSEDEDAVTITVWPSLGDLALADVATEDFEDLTIEPELGDALLIDTAVVDVWGYSSVNLGGMSSQDVPFTMEDVWGDVRKQVGTADLSQAAIQSLLENLELDLQVLGLGLGVNQNAITNAIASALQLATPAIDGILNQVTSAAGLQLGAAEVGVLGFECGKPMIVG